MISDQVVEGFITLFRGRGNAYGTDDGRCEKKPLERSVFVDHLLGYSPSIGVYPIVPTSSGDKVVWGCSDFDTADALQHASKLHEAFMAAGVITWIERSRSKGYHVWAFATEPVLAAEMRNMFLAAHQVADVPAKEVNPKQETLQAGKFGNYVRLPYPNAMDLSVPNQRVMDADGLPMPIGEFVEDALRCRITPDTIRALASMYVAPKKQSVVIDYTQYDASFNEAMTNLSPLGKVIWRDGPLEGMDRSRTLVKLGFECSESGLNPSETKIVLTVADKRWGKYHLRVEGEKEIDKIVMRVHS